MSLKTIAAYLSAAALLTACSRTEPEQEKAHASDSAKQGVSTNEHGVVVLEPASLTLAGIKTAAIETASVPPGVEAFGNVVDSASLATMVADLAAARASATASAAEVRRLETLVQQDNASDRALESARAVAARDASAQEAARLRLIASWGKGIAERNDLPRFAESLASSQSALVQLNVPLSEAPEGTPVSARITALAQPSKLHEAVYLSDAPNVDRNFQGRSLWFLLEDNQVRLVPGAAIQGFIALPGKPKAGVRLPTDAVVRHEGATWAYVQQTDNSFARVIVKPGERLGNGWLVEPSETLKPGARVVVSGAQQLLSEELKALGGE